MSQDPDASLAADLELAADFIGFDEYINDTSALAARLREHAAKLKGTK